MVRKPQPLAVLLFYGFVELALGIAFILWQRPTEKGTALLWSVGWFWVGMLVGFLFAFPKTSEEDAENHRAEGARGLDVNTNLGVISDWLTKTIVGVGLVELTKIPPLLDRTARYMAQGFLSSRTASLWRSR